MKYTSEHTLNYVSHKLTNRKFNIEYNDNLLGWILVVPSILIILAVILYPIVRTLGISLYQASLIDPNASTFVGIKNYVKFLQDPVFWATIRRTAYFTFVSVGIELVLGIGVALLINTRLRGWKVLRTCIIIPWAVPTIVNGAIWRWIYNSDYGALNGLLYQLGIIEKYVPWLSFPLRAMNLVILADIWHCVPFVALIMYAALSTFPEELYEAASIDGAGAFQRFFSITLPLLKPAILVVLVIRTVEAFKVFDIIYVITQGGPVFGTVVISYLTYLETFSYLHIGRGAALSFLVSLFIMVMALIYIKLLYTED